jgi:hypothetical protein
MTKDFPTEQALSAVTGYLLCPIDGVYAVLNWMTGEELYTHQLPRVGREAAPVLLAAHPELAAAYEEAGQIDRDNWKQWRDVWVARYGATISVPKMNHREHERIDPISELAEHIGPDKIIVVAP